MSYSDEAKNAALDAIGTKYPYLTIHSADPGTTGANEIGRVAVTWSGSSASAKTDSGTDPVIAVPANTDVTHWGLRTASTGTGATGWGGGFPVPTSEHFSGAGNYTATSISLSATG